MIENIFNDLIFYYIEKKPPADINIINNNISINKDMLDELFEEINKFDYVIINDSTNTMNNIITKSDFEQVRNGNTTILSTTITKYILNNSHLSIDEIMSYYKKINENIIYDYLSLLNWKDFFTDYYACKYGININIDNMYYITKKTNDKLYIKHLLTDDQIIITSYDNKKLITKLIWYYNDTNMIENVPQKLITIDIEYNKNNSIFQKTTTTSNNILNDKKSIADYIETEFIIKNNCNIFWSYYFANEKLIFNYLYLTIFKQLLIMNTSLDIVNANTKINNKLIQTKIPDIYPIYVDLAYMKL